MSEQSDDKSNPLSESDKAINLADELGITHISDSIVGGRGRLFSAAGRESPIAEFTGKYLVLHPPNKPYDESDFVESQTELQSATGILLDEFGNFRKIIGAKFQGHPLFRLVEKCPDTKHHVIGWLDETNQVHKLFFENKLLTERAVIKLRNRTHDGEISTITGITS